MVSIRVTVQLCLSAFRHTAHPTTNHKLPPRHSKPGALANLQSTYGVNENRTCITKSVPLVHLHRSGRVADDKECQIQGQFRTKNLMPDTVTSFAYLPILG